MLQKKERDINQQKKVIQQNEIFPGVFNKETGEIISNPSTKSSPKYQDVFGETIIELANKMTTLSE